MKNMLKHLRTGLVLAAVIGSSIAAKAQYCTPTYTTGTAEGDYINGVTVGTIANTFSGAAITGVGYSDYTFLSTDLNIGDAYTMTCNNNPSWSQTYTAWIDYDHDNTFETSEVLGNLSLSASATGSFSFTVPVTAMSGTTRMRVRCIYPSGLVTPLDPCALATYGETEDYTVNLLGGAMNDVGVIDITNPTTGPGLGMEDVIVTVRNYGSEPASGFTVSYQVDGGLVTAGFYGGTIAPFSTGSWTAPEGWDFSAEGCYNITAWTTLAGDEDPGNDSYTEEVCHTGAVTGTGAIYMLSNTTGGEPWFTTNNSTAMTTVFGAEGTGWNKNYYETAPAATVFTPDNCFVFMEGSDGHANELETYLTANMAVIESWVSSGGKLLLNAAPNEGDGMSFGFGGTSLVYSYFTSTANGVGGHPIFSGPYTPAGTTYTGTSFGHARITGTGLTNVMVDAAAPSNVVLAEKTWGGGIVMFGGMTTDNWHDPDPNAANLRANIFSYLSCEVVTDCPAPVGLGADAITGTSAHLFWDPSLNSGGYHLSVYKTDETLVLKKKVLGGATDWTVTGLTPGTDYAFHVRSICTGLGMASDISYHYYFTTPARLGDENTNVVLFPNPNTGTFDIALNGYEGQQVNIQIVSALGQTVYNNTVNVNATGFTQNVNLNNAAAGMYYVNILTDKGVMNYQVVITD
ncbi:MAG TPA: GEVED domain-containing protein [Chitinophagales bacterium]|nr:T9SS type A sorting domain-containing protein [Chitinophagales bacterium]HMZ87776.1 GEVED domain-containing protein [Chitinophagales bacterium]HNA56917.1 GEVED domain-containing protein [Chitinophagales bacterium]HNE45292.1 GEVED domain-containing protein [Chitinophagales bacterium]HNI54413.1 GEVED domain-containing protein [Chitinophagales bacterium]